MSRQQNKKSVAIIGRFDIGQAVADGQSVKTTILTEELERIYGAENVTRIDTYDWKKRPFALLIQSVAAVWMHRNVMILVDENGIRVFPRLLRLANLFGKCRLHYYVVGGWLSRYLDRDPLAVRMLQKLDVIYVELPAMRRELEERGFGNVVLVNKFRRMTPVSEADIEKTPEKPYKLCFFSRVMKEKGIEDAVAAVKQANDRAGYEKFSLDIFGAVHADYRDAFETMKASFPPFIRYGGVVDFRESGKVLKEYFAMLFPTVYASEGYPNAVVDAFAAGLPVIATRWNYNGDIIRDGEDGILIGPGDVQQLAEAMESLSADLELHGRMRKNCLARCREYLPEYAVTKVVEALSE